MKQVLETIKHDFLIDPLYYITLALAGVLICVLIGGAITSIIYSGGGMVDAIGYTMRTWAIRYTGVVLMQVRILF